MLTMEADWSSSLQHWKEHGKEVNAPHRDLLFSQESAASNFYRNFDEVTTTTTLTEFLSHTFFYES